MQRSRTVGQSIELVLGNVDCRLGLAEQRNNGLARVASNNGDDGLAGILLASDGLHEGLGTNDIKGGDTKELLGVEDTGALEDLGSDWDGRVDGVGDDENVSLGAELGNTLDDVANDSGVDLEQVVTGHTGLPYSHVNSRSHPIDEGRDSLGIPAGMTIMSAPVKACFIPSSLGR